jgi:hypothetical protein
VRVSLVIRAPYPVYVPSRKLVTQTTTHARRPIVTVEVESQAAEWALEPRTCDTNASCHTTMSAFAFRSAARAWTRAYTAGPQCYSARTTCLYSTSSATPWFVDEFEDSRPVSGPSTQQTSVPSDAPSPLKAVHARLSTSPLLEPSTLQVTQSLKLEGGPTLPAKRASGTRRKRGGTYAGESDYDVPGGLWSWWLIAQVLQSMLSFLRQN